MGTTWGSKENPARVFIAMPIYDTVEPATARSLRNLIVPTKDGGQHGFYGCCECIETNGVTIEQARNDLTSHATSYVPGATHVLFVDSDMVFPPDALQRLLAHDKPVVGGLCFNRRPPYAPIVMRVNHPDWQEEEGPLGHVYNYPKDQLVEVDATGAAFLLVNVDVFSATYSGIPSRPGWFDRLPGMSEDFSFCVRANQCDLQVFVDTSLRLGHIGKIVVDEAFAERNRTTRALPWRSGARSG